MSQRDWMRHYYQLYHGEREHCVAAYAQAERDGEITRRSNIRRIPSEEYASRLFADGLQKGWLP